MARPGQLVVAGDRLADRIGIGVLAKVFPPELVDRVVDHAGARERRSRALPARVVVITGGVHYPLRLRQPVPRHARCVRCRSWPRSWRR